MKELIELNPKWIIDSETDQVIGISFNNPKKCNERIGILVEKPFKLENISLENET